MDVLANFICISNIFSRLLKGKTISAFWERVNVLHSTPEFEKTNCQRLDRNKKTNYLRISEKLQIKVNSKHNPILPFYWNINFELD